MSRIVWMDMEMTGLDVKRDRIMELSCVITNNDLDVLATGPTLIVHHPQSTLDAMNEWCRTTHAKVRCPNLPRADVLATHTLMYQCN